MKEIPYFCPNCNADLREEPIPEEKRMNTNSTHPLRVMGISSIELDRIVHWQCPDCNGLWDSNKAINNEQEKA